MSRQLIVCLDGTYNTPGQLDHGRAAPTNVWKLAKVLSCDESRDSVRKVKYLPGVGHGTSAAIGWFCRFLNRISVGTLDHWFGGASGWGLSQQIREGYKFLVDEYIPGDQIFIFGFSRGAFAARSLVGLIKNAGLLNREASPLIRRVTRAYHRLLRAPKHRAFLFFVRPLTYTEARVHFLGVWDTVGALGAPIEGGRFSLNPLKMAPRFHDIDALDIVDATCHALAIDELRAAYSPVLFHRGSECTARLEQVWFRGAHSDVGGGYSDSRLSDVTLSWMVNRANKVGLGLPESCLRIPPGGPSTAEPRDSIGHMWVAGVWPRSFPTALGTDEYSPDIGHLDSSVDEIRSEASRVSKHWLVDLEPREESAAVVVDANRFWVNTRLIVRREECYLVRAEGNWRICGRVCGADGVANIGGRCRDPEAQMGELVLLVSGGQEHPQPEGKFWNAVPYLLGTKVPTRVASLAQWTSLPVVDNGRLLIPCETGVLHCFANSKARLQRKNRGRLTLCVTRVPTYEATMQKKGSFPARLPNSRVTTHA
jgi:hypothetical protein